MLQRTAEKVTDKISGQENGDTRHLGSFESIDCFSIKLNWFHREPRMVCRRSTYNNQYHWVSTKRLILKEPWKKLMFRPADNPGANFGGECLEYVNYVCRKPITSLSRRSSPQAARGNGCYTYYILRSYVVVYSTSIWLPCQSSRGKSMLLFLLFKRAVLLKYCTT